MEALEIPTPFLVDLMNIGRFYARDVKVVWDVKVVLRRL